VLFAVQRERKLRNSFGVRREPASAGTVSGQAGEAQAQNEVAPRRRGFTLSLKGRALRLLAGREHSRSELEKKLRVHEEAPGQLAQVLDDLQAKDFISETRVVESVINRRSSRLGAARIRHELVEKGVSREQIDEAIGGLQASELDRARELWQRKFGLSQGEGPLDAATRARQMRFLLSRGFSGAVVNQVLRAGRNE
jgi:regulatory protein